MSSTATTNVAVEELSKYGFKSNGRYFNWSKQIKESDKGKVVPGGTYRMDVYTADSGKEYVNSVDGAILVPKTVTKPDVGHNFTSTADIPKVHKAKPEISLGLSKDEWKAKDTRISRQGIIQVAVQVAGTFEEAVVLADKMLVFVNEVA